MARFQVWDWNTNKVLAESMDESSALSFVRRYAEHKGRDAVEERIGLVDKGAPGEVLTYPLEGAALLAKAFGLEES